MGLGAVALQFTDFIKNEEKKATCLSAYQSVVQCSIVRARCLKVLLKVLIRPLKARLNVVLRPL